MDTQTQPRTASSPRFCILLKLEKHIVTLFVILEMVHVIYDQDQRFVPFPNTT